MKQLLLIVSLALLTVGVSAETSKPATKKAVQVVSTQVSRHAEAELILNESVLDAQTKWLRVSFGTCGDGRACTNGLCCNCDANGTSCACETCKRGTEPEPLGR